MSIARFILFMLPIRRLLVFSTDHSLLTIVNLCSKLNYVSYTQVPGFRPGKRVPENVIVSYIGKKNVQKATVESILKRTLPHAMSAVSNK